MEEHHRTRDPVCGKTLDKKDAYSAVEYKQHKFYLCCPMCRDAFMIKPGRFILRSDRSED